MTPPWDTWSNIEVNAVAKMALDHCVPVMEPAKYCIPFSTWICYLGATQVIKQFAWTIQNYLGSHSTQANFGKQSGKFQRPCGIPLTGMYWPSIHRIILAKDWWVAKYTSRYFGHDKNMIHWHFCSTVACPRCWASSEDKVHILTCPDRDTNASWEKALQDLKLWLQEHHTDKDIFAALIEGLWQWCNQQEGTYIKSYFSNSPRLAGAIS